MLQLLTLALLLYPAYRTHKALRRGDPELTRRWLQWWVVLTVYRSVQLLTDLALGAMPVYAEVKLLGLVYLVWDEGAGGQVVFERLVGPLLKTHEREIDAQLERAKGHAAAKLGDLKEAAVGALAQKGQEIRAESFASVAQGLESLAQGLSSSTAQATGPSEVAPPDVPPAEEVKAEVKKPKKTRKAD